MVAVGPSHSARERLQAAYLAVKDARGGMAQRQAEAAAGAAIGAAARRRTALADVASLLARLSAAKAARIAVTCAPRLPGRRPSVLPPAFFWPPVSLGPPPRHLSLSLDYSRCTAAVL